MADPAATILEVTLVIERGFGDAGGREFDLWLNEISSEVVPVDSEQTERRAVRGAAVATRAIYVKAFKDSTALYYGEKPTLDQILASIGIWTAKR